MSKVFPWVFVLLLVWIGLEVRQLRTGQTLPEEVGDRLRPMKPAEDAAAPRLPGQTGGLLDANADSLREAAESWRPASSPSR